MTAAAQRTDNLVLSAIVAVVTLTGSYDASARMPGPTTETALPGLDRGQCSSGPSQAPADDLPDSMLFPAADYAAGVAAELKARERDRAAGASR